MPTQICALVAGGLDLSYDTDKVTGCTLPSMEPSQDPSNDPSDSPSSLPSMEPSQGPSSSPAGCSLCTAITNQKDALLALKEGLINNDASKLTDWDTTTDPCTNAWTGIWCDSDGKVTGIDLRK